MVPDLDFIDRTFKKYNFEIFESGLPRPKYSLTRARTFRGKLIYKLNRKLRCSVATDFEIRVSISFDLPQREWEDVIIHEMIHLHVASKGIKDSSSHGPQFRNLMKIINSKHGRNITVAARSSAEERIERNADKRVKAHYVCLAKFSDGRLGVAPVAKTCIFKLWDLNKFFPAVVSIKWIGSTSPYFNSLPHVQSPKLYIVEKENLKPHLKGACILQREGNRIKVVSQRMTPDELLP